MIIIYSRKRKRALGKENDERYTKYISILNKLIIYSLKMSFSSRCLLLSTLQEVETLPIRVDTDVMHKRI